jgi:ribosomal protein L40E
MDSPPPAPWTFAARAGYFGDRVCPFCDHRNPAGAKFCNDCGSPLHMKACNECDAVNHQAATNCYQCGAECPALFTTPEATPVLPATGTTPAWATPGDVGVAATVTQPLFAAGALRAEWRLAAIATILIAGAYAAYRINAATPDAMGVASQPVGAGEHNARTVASAVPMAVESKPVEPETTAALQAPIPTTNPETPKRASVRQRPGPVPATKDASVRQRQAPAGSTLPVTQTLAAAHVGALAAETRIARRPDPWQAMHVSLARCDGDLLARIVCDQRVRRRFCEGHWGEAPECASGVANDRGQ